MNPTGSSLWRADQCPASEAMPHVQVDTEYSEHGHLKHEFLNRCDQVGREKALLELDEDSPITQWAQQVPLDRLPKGGKRELAVCWNSETDAVVVLGTNIGRGYRKAALEHGIDPNDDTWWFLTIDHCGRVGEVADVTDYKSGYRSAGDAETAPQLLLGTLCITRLYGLDEAVQRFIYLDERGQVKVDEARVEDFKHLIPFAQRLRALPARIEAEREKVSLGVIPDVHAGEWCTFCPAKRSCPAKAAQLVKSVARARGFSNDQVSLDRAAVQALAPSELGKVFADLEGSLPLLEELKSCIKEMAEHSPIPLPDGRELRAVTVANKTKVVADVAEKLIKKRFGAEAAGEAIKTEPRTTMKALSAMVVKRAPPGEGARHERQFYEELRAEGGLVEGHHVEVKAVKAGR